MKSWRTTVLGILAGLAILITQAIAALDGDPETVFNLDAVIAALATMGIGVAARDNIVSSEKAGAVPGAKALLLACLLMPAIGCADVPGHLVVGHVDAVSPDHLARLEAAAEDPPRVIPATSSEVDTYRANWEALRDAGESAKNATR